MNDLTIYNQIKDKMKTGDGLGFNHSGFIPGIINWWTRKTVDPQFPIRLSHFGGIIRFAEFEGTVNRRYTVEAESNGFYPRILSNYIKDYKGDIYWYQLKPAWEPFRNLIGEDIMSMIGIGYDFLGAIECGIGRANTNMRHLFCSKGWQIGYQNTAPQLLNDVGGRALAPAEMWKLGCFRPPIKFT